MRIDTVLLIYICLSLLGCDHHKSASVSTTAADFNMENEQAQELLIYDSFDDIEYIFNYKNDTTYVINFWATWCKPCVEELPYFDLLFNDYSEDKVKIILVSLDFPKHIQSKLIPYLEENNVLPQVMVLKDGNANNWINKVSENWDGAIPITLVYNKHERVFIGGEVPDYASLEAKVKPLIIY